MKRIEKILVGILIIAVFLCVGVSVSAETYKIESVVFTDATVNTSVLNMRQGPSTSMPIVTKLEKSQAVRVLGKTGEWYFVFDSKSGKVGCVHGQYITPVTSETVDDTKLPNEGGTSYEEEENTPTGLSADEQSLLDLVNSARESAGVGKISYNKELARVALHKAQDMVENNYFSHQSKIYGTPLEMMRSYGIKFKAAAENIAGNRTVENAFYSWMKSESHKKNILNPDYDEMGIGVCISPVYGKIVVQMFIKN